jgi:hypothetical protein
VKHKVIGFPLPNQPIELPCDTADPWSPVVCIGSSPSPVVVRPKRGSVRLGSVQCGVRHSGWLLLAGGSPRPSYSTIHWRLTAISCRSADHPTTVSCMKPRQVDTGVPSVSSPRPVLFSATRWGDSREDGNAGVGSEPRWLTRGPSWHSA